LFNPHLVDGRIVIDTHPHVFAPEDVITRGMTLWKERALDDFIMAEDDSQSGKAIMG